jgi:hypothetical protein
MHQKINRYILLTTFLLLFPSYSYYIQIPLKIFNESYSRNYSFKESNYHIANLRQITQKMKSCKERKKNEPLYSYLNSLDNNLLSFEIKIGSDKQKFNVIIDTGSSILWVSGEGSEDKDVQISHHYNPKTSLTSKKTNFTYKIRYGSGYSLGYYYYDQIKLFNNIDDNYNIYMNFGVANKTIFKVPGADGIFGLGRGAMLNNSPIFCLKNKSFIDKAGFSIKYNYKLKNAILYFGEEHEDFRNKKIGFCPLLTDTFKEKNFWSCKLFSFGILYKELNSTINLNLSIIFDTGTNSIVLPRYILSFLYKKLNKIDCSINENSLEISTIICYNKNKLPDIILEIGDYYLTLSKTNFFHEQTLQNKTVVYYLNIFFEDGIENGIIGLPFFYEFHTRFDLEKNEMKFYHSNSKKINKSFSKKNQKESDINSKLKISIIILAIIALVLLIIIFRYKYCCNMKKNSYRIENIEISTSDDSASKHSFSLLD